MRCQECGVRPDQQAKGWRAYRADDPEEGEGPLVLFYCPRCAEREFGPFRYRRRARPPGPGQ